MGIVSRWWDIVRQVAAREGVEQVEQRRPTLPAFVFLRKCFPCSARKRTGPSRLTAIDVGSCAENTTKRVSFFNNVTCELTHLVVMGSFCITKTPLLRARGRAKEKSDVKYHGQPVDSLLRREEFGSNGGRTSKVMARE